MGVFVLDYEIDFLTGTTTRGAPINGMSQTETGTGAYLKKVAGSGVIVDTPDNPPCYLFIPQDASRYEGAWEIDTGPVSGVGQTNTTFEVTGRTPSPVVASAAGGIFLNYGGQLNTGYTLRWRLSNDFTIFDGPTGNPISVNGGGGTGTAGHSYRIRQEIVNGAAGHSIITGKMWDLADLTTLLGDTSVDDTDAALNNPVGSYQEGTGAQGFWCCDQFGSGANWKITKFRAFHYVAQLPPAVIASAVLNASGTTVSVSITSAGAPMTTTGGARPTGFSVQHRANTSSAWLPVPIVNTVLRSDVATLLLQNAIPASHLFQVLYDNSVGNVFDTLSTPAVAMASNTGFAGTNNSTYVPSGVPWPFQTIVAATRGNAVTKPSLTYSGVEVQTMFRVEVPYGLAPGWSVGYAGFNNGGITDDIIILGAAYWIAPDGIPFQFPVGYLTFSGGAAGATVAHDTIVDCDPVAMEIRPGTVMWITLWYKTGNPATKLPTHEPWMYVKVLTAGTEDQDGVLSGAIGALTNAALLGGGFHHDGTPFPVVGFLSEGYHHYRIKGKPANDYRGEWASVLWIGDSIDAGSLDFGSDNTPLSARGYQGRRCGISIPYVTSAVSGAGTNNFTGATGAAWFTDMFGNGTSILPLFTVGGNEYGINDVRTRNPPTDVSAYLTGLRQAVADIFATYNRNLIQSTLAPCLQIWTAFTPSSGPNDALFAIWKAQRGVFNDLARTSNMGRANILACYDWNSVLEDPPSSNSDVWVAANNSDGLHPNTAGHIAASSASIIIIPMNIYPPAPGPGHGSGAKMIFTYIPMHR